MADEMGVPPAVKQSAAWVGGEGVVSGRKTFLQHFEDRVRETARQRGETPLQALRHLLRWEYPMLGIGGAALLGGLGGGEPQHVQSR
jgi:hypothetical protein